MKPKKREKTYNEEARLLANRYNDYQNTNIYDSNYNYMDTELAQEMFNFELYMDQEFKKMR